MSGQYAGTRTLLVQRRIGEEAGCDLYSITGIAIDSRQNLYVTDMMDFSLKQYSEKGVYTGKVGRRGNGPGEFRAPNKPFVWNDTVLILDIHSPRIQLFTRQLHYAGGFFIKEGVPFDIAISGNGKVYVALFGEDERARLVIHDMHGRPQGSVSLKPKGDGHTMYNFFRLAVASDGDIIVAYVYLNEVDVYGNDGTFRFSFTNPWLNPGPRGTELVDWPEDIYAKGVQTDIRGRIYLLGGNQSPHDARDVYLFDPRGRGITCVTLEHRTRVILLTQGGWLFGTDDDGTAVEGYRLDFESER
jgi:hypothetical protein